MIKIAIDTGGTFTDFTAAGTVAGKPYQQQCLKYATDREDPAASVMAGLGELAAAWDLELSELLAETEQIVYGTTLALNALLEKKGAKTALFTTEGFRDALEIRRSQLKNQWDLRALTPTVLVPRRLRLGIAQRMDYKGDVLRDLEEESVVAACVQCREAGVSSIAVCYLFSFLNPAHEERTAEIIRRELPGVFVSLSSAVAPKIREYERTSTTVLNAYLTPLLRDYLAVLKERLAAYGWEKPLHIMMNSGGVSDTESEGSLAVRTLMSGPAGGACGNKDLALACGREKTILADMGGTSFDVHVVDGEEQDLIPGAEIDGYPLSLPMIAIHSIGAGGGSIVRVDGGGRLLIGPDSAGSRPGPVCYGRGGTEPTITDALLLLDLLDEEGFLGGKMKLDREAAAAAMAAKVAVPLGVDVLSAARMVYSVAAEKMADAIRLVTVARGRDVRDYSLISAGGAFSLFAVHIMKTLKMREVLFPATSPVFCAWGMMNAGRRCDFSRSVLMEEGGFDADAITKVLVEMKTAGNQSLDHLGVPFDRRSFGVTAQMRYIGQHHEIAIPWQDAYLDAPGELGKAFHGRHEAVYGYAEATKAWEIIDFQLACFEEGGENQLFAFDAARGEREKTVVCGAPFGSDTALTVPLCRPGVLGQGRELSGPALIETDYTTVLIPAGAWANLSQNGVITIGEKGDGDHDSSK